MHIYGVVLHYIIIQKDLHMCTTYDFDSDRDPDPIIAAFRTKMVTLSVWRMRGEVQDHSLSDEQFTYTNLCSY